ncbi:OapC/ArvC family zinc-ribbon domain-containing protein [Halobacterium rubrum]|uniref:OapC/ArvC family zinc-ribbon domain-containing protein n=1 Tax=Halobacterium TaxID=2239 RepID=UPI001F444D17|nr:MULTISPECIES: Zn-ribbon containing protein [Halobacterium]MDH5018752.1 Zn-ribbon containing protein [Halobacterium rubrum]
MPHQCTNCGHVFEDGSKEMLSGCPDCGGNKFQYHPGEVPDEPAVDDAEQSEPPEPEGGSVTGAVGRAANRVRDAVSSGPPSTDAVSDEDEATDDGATVDTATGDDGATVDAATGEDSANATATSDDEDSANATATSDDEDAVPQSGGPTSSTADPDRAGSGAAPETEEVERADSGTDPAVDGVDTGDTATTADAADEAGVQASTADEEDGAQADARSEVVDMSSLPDRADDGRVVKEPDDSEDRPDIEDLRQELNDQFESIRIVAPGQYELNLMELYDRQEYIIALQEDGQYVIEVPDAWEAPDPTETE